MINQSDLSNVLVGQNSYYIHDSVFIHKENQLNFSPEWPSRPVPGTGGINPREFPRHQTDIFLESHAQSIYELSQDYTNKAMMSLDGIFSPISFYPTPYSSTFHITKYPTPNCPFCFGTKIYQYSVVIDDISSTLGVNSAGALGEFNLNINGALGFKNSYIQERSRPCVFCENISDKRKKLESGFAPREVMPPHIIVSGTDSSILNNISITGLTGIPIINYSTLNPIVLSSGSNNQVEFSNYQNKQSGDYCGHTIGLVAFGAVVPRNQDGLRSAFNRNIERSFLDYDLNLAEWKNDMGTFGISIPDIPTLSNNMRFFGLRGPIMLHSWGYDVEGYPVPNSSGEPLVDMGVVIRDQNNNILGKNQKLVAGTWTKPYKENTFYKGWAQQPGSWPVGPIDFRWDDTAGVWTVGANYKAVYVLIEEDLVDTNPARGTILENANSNPLPSGLRRLVFVKDDLGLYSAPRGAALYCKYNSFNGFYEPIGFRPFITSGIIESYNTATIYKIYTTGNSPNLRLSDNPNVERYSATYKNPLGYQASVNSVGLFTFLNGSWVLQSFNSD